VSEDTVIEVVGLRKGFGSVVAVDGLSFTVERGSIVGLLGANGAGKTTTLRMLLGLIRPQAGSVTVLGERMRFGAKVLGRVGSLVEGPGFIPHVSGRRNLELYWRAGGRHVGPSDVDEALGVSGLGDAAGRKVRTYSLGMKQRLAFAQALLGKPELLVLDEPVNGLDPHQIVFVREALLRLAREGTTILLSSHLLWEVEQTCDKVVVVDHGRLVKAGTVAEVTGGAASAYVEVDDPHRAVELLQRVPGIISAVPAPPGIVVQLGRALRSDLVGTLVAAGIRVETVMPRHSLEAAFLEMVGPNGCPPVELLGELLSALPAPMVGAAEGTAGAAEGTAGAAEGMVGAAEGMVGAAEGMVGAAEGMVGAAEGMPAQGDRT
jgi:ABC-2 type transport system ATP-binding protein